jgi:uncharacterized membrane protein
MVAFVLLVVVHALLGAISVSSRVPGIDVYLIQKQGCEKLMAGQNPFAMTFDDVYGPDAAIYPPGIVENGQVQCGYFYPPLSLLLDLPGHLIGDVRYSHVAAIALSALLIGFMRPSRDSFLAAAALLFSPRLFYQLQVAWIEPFVLLMLSATVFFAIRKRAALAAAAFGLFVVSKQYAIFAIPAAWLLQSRLIGTRRLINWMLIAAAAGAIATLPFIVWNPQAFFHSMTALYVGVVRYDSISFLPPLLKTFRLRPSLAYSAIAALPAIVMVLWRAPRTAQGFAAGVALILLCTFAFSTQSFGNYYFLIIGALAAAIAAAPVEALDGKLPARAGSGTELAGVDLPDRDRADRSGDCVRG